MHRTPLLLLAFLLPFISTAQLPSEAGKKNVWMGINAADLLVKETLLIPSVVLNWKINENHNLRFQLGYDVVSTTSDYDVNSLMPFNNFEVDSVSENNPFKSWESTFRMGYYKTRPINKKLDLFYGTELVYRYQRINYRKEFSITQNFGGSNSTFIDVDEKENATLHGFGISPFAGIYWHVSEGVQLGFETQAAFETSSQKSEYFLSLRQTSAFNPNVFEQNSHRKKSNSNSISRLLPIAGIYLLIQL